MSSTVWLPDRNWKEEEFDNSHPYFRCHPYAYALIRRRVEGRMAHDVLVMRRRGSMTWEFPGGAMFRNTTGPEGLVRTCAQVMAATVWVQEVDKLRPEFHFAQVLIRAPEQGRMVAWHCSVVTYLATLAPDAVVAPAPQAEGENIVEAFAWIDVRRLRKQGTHPLCWPALALYQSYERHEYPF